MRNARPFAKCLDYCIALMIEEQTCPLTLNRSEKQNQMSKSSLALLDEAVQGAVALLLGAGEHDKTALAELGVVPQRTRNVAGLKVVSNAARDADVHPNSAKMTDNLLHSSFRSTLPNTLMRWAFSLSTIHFALCTLQGSNLGPSQCK